MFPRMASYSPTLNCDSLQVRRVAELAHLYDVSLKINTTVTRRTLGDDLAPLIVALSPIERWKLFQMLPLEGENSNGAARRCAFIFSIQSHFC